MSFSGLFKRQMMGWLSDVAAKGERCPSNVEIADRFNFESVATSTRLLAELEAMKLITVERFHQARVVTIAATGQSTFRPANAKPHWRLQSAVPAIKPAPAKPKISAAVIRAAKLDGRDLPTFVTALIDMGLDCWRDDRTSSGEPVT